MAIKMKMYLISDNVDTKTGMRLAGIEGVVVHGHDEVAAAFKNAVENIKPAIILITQKAANDIKEELAEAKMSMLMPLITTIADRHGNDNFTDTIAQCISEAVGIKI